MVANSESATIDAIEGCCARIEAMCADLDEAEWKRPTALPAWTVQDVVAHLGSLDGMLLGRDEPHHQPAATGHVRNELGMLNERFVDRRRSWSGAEVLDEFRETTGLRLEELRALREDELDTEVPSPTGGMVPLRRFLGIRLWDFLVHDMDLAEALGLDPDIDTPAGRRVLDEMLFLLPRAVARARTAEGSVVRLSLGEPLAREVAVRMEGGRAAGIAPETAGEAALHLRASPAVFLRVGAGRRQAAAAIAAGDVVVDGDGELAARVLDAVNVVP